jgi:hypothetical protein
MVQALVDADRGTTALDIVQLARKNPSRPNLKGGLEKTPKNSWLAGSG